MKNLKYLRELRGISQQALADEIGVSQQSINAYENYGTDAGIDVIIKISNYFNTSTDFLLGNQEKTKSGHITKDEAYLLSICREMPNSVFKALITLLEFTKCDSSKKNPR